RPGVARCRAASPSIVGSTIAIGVATGDDRPRPHLPGPAPGWRDLSRTGAALPAHRVLVVGHRSVVVCKSEAHPDALFASMLGWPITGLIHCPASGNCA